MRKQNSKMASGSPEVVAENIDSSMMVSLLNNLPGMAYRCLTDGDYTMLFISGGCKNLTGYTPQELLGNKLCSYTSLTFPDDLEETLKKITHAIKNHSHYIMEYRITKKNGTVAWVWEQGNAIYDEQGKALYLDGYIAEITEQKQMEFSLKKASQDLLELNSAKDRFFSLIAHDLQNPVYAIISLVDFLSSNFLNLSSDELLSFISQINLSAKGIYELLENLLDWARAQIGKINIQEEKISLQRFIMNVVEHFRPYYSSKNITITFQPERDIYVYLDSWLLNSILRNLINNAIKFSYPGTRVEITLSSTKDKVLLSVIDEGIGISKKQLERIFTLGKEDRSFGTNQEPGSGLGLVLAKEFCDLLGAEIKISSKLNQGSTFTLVLPKMVAKE